MSETGVLSSERPGPAGGSRPAGDGQPILRAEGLRRAFGGVTAVDGVSISAQSGRCIGLIGPNGAGKSTLLNILAGAERPQGGRVLLDGRDVTRLPAYKRARLGLIRTFQIASEFSNLTALENLLVAVPDELMNSLAAAFFPRRWAPVERQHLGRAKQLLAGVQLEGKADQLAGTLSGGERRMVEIARALMSNPKVLLLDEPTAGVNAARIRDIEAYLGRVRDSGVCILLVEHQLDVVARLCDHVYVMAQGLVIAEGSLDEVRRDPAVIDAYIG